MSSVINISESLQKTIQHEQRVLADGGTLVNRNCTVNSIPYTILRQRPSLALVPSAYKESKAYAILPNTGAGDFDVVRATGGTVRNENGLIEDACYNLLRYSEEFDNGYWVKSAGISVSANTTISPDGNTTADTITKSGVSTSQLLRTPNIAIPSTDRYTFTLYLKKSTLDSSVFLLRNETTFTNINSTITILEGDASADNTSATFKKVVISDLDFIRVQITTDVNITAGNNIRVIIYPDNVSPQASGNIIFFGAQLEQGATPTTYQATRGVVAVPATYQLPNGKIEKVIMT